MFRESKEEIEILSTVRKFVDVYEHDSCDFELCNGYLLQASRNGIQAVIFEDGIVVVTKKKNSSQHVIVAVVGKNRAEKAYTVASNLFKELGSAVIIKNVGNILENELLGRGFRNYTQDECWDTHSKYDDNTFPEQVLNTYKLVQMRGTNLSSMRADISRFNRDYKIDIERLEKCTLEMVKEILEKWMDEMYFRNNIDKSELFESHKIFFFEHPGLIYFQVKDIEKQIPIGFIVFSEISSACLGYNVLINDFKYRNLYRILLLEGTKIAHSLGYKFINVQGSEDLRQYISKRRLKADFEIKKRHLIFEYSK